MAQQPLHSQQLRGEMIQYAIRLSDRKLVHISDVRNGKDCDCICPSLQCQSALIAVNGEGIKVAQHFRHASEDNHSRPCANASGIQETVTHIKAKEWIKKHKQIALPLVAITKGADPDGCEYKAYIIRSPEDHNLSKVVLEETEDNFVPDCTAYIGDRKTFIEVYVNHKVDEEKSEKIRKRGIDTIEIVFNKGLVDPTDADLEKYHNESSVR